MRVRWVLGGAAAACAAAVGTAPPATPSLAGRTFVATEFVYDGDTKPIWAMGGLPLRFDPDGVRFFTVLGCNAFAGTYEIADGRFRPVGGSSASGCSIGDFRPAGDSPLYGRTPDRFYLDVGPELENPLSEFYESGPTIRAGPSTLTLSTARGHLVLQRMVDRRALAARELRETQALLRDPRWLG